MTHADPIAQAEIDRLTAENKRLRAAVKFQREGAEETGLIAERAEAEVKRLRGKFEGVLADNRGLILKLHALTAAVDAYKRHLPVTHWPLPDPEESDA